MSNLLEPLPEFLPLLEAFFSTNEYPRLEWIHDLAKTVSKFSSATLALNDASNSETKLESRHVRTISALFDSISHYALGDVESYQAQRPSWNGNLPRECGRSSKYVLVFLLKRTLHRVKISRPSQVSTGRLTQSVSTRW